MTDIARVELAPGYSVARVINGCWQLTPDHGGGPAGKNSLGRFAELVEHGFTTFDCADIYTGTEELLGRFRRTLTDPDAMQVHTKLVPNKNSLAELTDAQIDATIDQSRKRLGMEQLDLVQFHWWDYGVAGLDRLYDRLLQAQSNGKIRLLGVTNFNTEKLRGLLQQNPSIVSIQAQYSLLDRRPEKELHNCCADNNVALLPYGVLAGGFLSDKYRGQPEPGTLNRSLQKYRLIIDEAGGWERFRQLLAALADVAEKHRVGIDAIATRWVLDRPTVAAIILGIGRRSRVTENLALAQLRLDDEDRETITECLQKLA
ncbi:MAG: aldo/keto reductase, partial [Gammaproteobacteria bacterium]|nr:aldo/keto reductase [Gammaproteobacteria bacterium]